jgi:hypothetical protein
MIMALIALLFVLLPSLIKGEKHKNRICEFKNFKILHFENFYSNKEKKIQSLYPEC